MAQPLIRDFLGELLARVEYPDPVVEFGSMQVEEEQEGDLRPLFAGRDYVGTDFREGPGVDRVEDLRSLTFEDGSVGTAICIDTLEHCADPPMACRELARVTSSERGLCVISSVMLFGIHGYPNDYFRFTPEGFRTMLEGFEHTWVTGVGHPDIPTQVIGVGANGIPLDLAFEDFPSLVAEQRRFDACHRQVRIGVHNYRPIDLLKAIGRDAPRLVREHIRR